MVVLLIISFYDCRLSITIGIHLQFVYQIQGWYKGMKVFKKKTGKCVLELIVIVVITKFYFLSRSSLSSNQVDVESLLYLFVAFDHSLDEK